MRYSKFLVTGFLALMALSFTACSSSDDDGKDWGKIEQPAHIADAARYKVTTIGSKWKSVELTEGGRYFIVLENNMLSSSSSDDVIYSGSYEKKDDHYVLNGFGELTIIPNKQSFKLLLNNQGYVSNLSAQKAGTLSSNKANDYLCRTWRLVKYHVDVTYDGKKVYDGTSTSTTEIYNGLKSAINASEYKDKLKLSKTLLDDIEDLDILRTITFTHTGSYYVTNTDSREDMMYYWKWMNFNELVIAFSDEENNFSAKDRASLQFEDGQLKMNEHQSEGREKINVVTTFQPVK